jgi:hypothetical protein
MSSRQLGSLPVARNGVPPVAGVWLGAPAVAAVWAPRDVEQPAKAAVTATQLAAVVSTRNMTEISPAGRNTYRV